MPALAAWRPHACASTSISWSIAKPAPPLLLSPVQDILDKDEFTLQELLEEDELLQEVKAQNEKLLAL